MVAHGRVQDGVVILRAGVRLPEGQEVIVLVPDTAPPARPTEGPRSHSVLDITTVTLGTVLRPLAVNDDLLGEMLEGR